MELIGRESLVDEILAAAGSGAHVLLTGRVGVGKSAVLQAVAVRLPRAVTVPAGTPKTAMLTALEGAHTAVGLRMPSDVLPVTVQQRARRRGYLKWGDLSYTIRRMTLSAQAELLQRSLAGRKATVLVDSLEVPPTLAEALTPLFDVAQVIAAKDDNNRRIRIERLLWRFTVKIEVKPLDPVASRHLTEAAIAEHPPRFANTRIRERFVRHVAHASGGIPAAILGMVAEAATEAEITPARAAAFSHDAARVYLDMTPLVIVALVVFVALRYVSRGIDSQELFVLSGVASALFVGARFAFALLRR